MMFCVHRVGRKQVKWRQRIYVSIKIVITYSFETLSKMMQYLLFSCEGKFC